MDVNSALSRKVKGGSLFGSLIDKSNCQTSFLGKGDTYKSMDLISQQALKYRTQSQRWAKKLQKSTLAQTVKSNYDFLYNHFQYKADGYKQQLYSPKCAWLKRYEGIDCKSFSLIASTLLLNQNINHFLRKITQPGFNENEFTHVYVVIPKNQKTNDLKEGYYIIDATTHNNIEPIYLRKHDVFMESLPHYGLNGKGNCSPKHAKKVVKASIAGRKLYQGKSVGGRDLAKWRWGLLAPAQSNDIISKLLLLKELILKSGYNTTHFNAMLNYIHALIASGVAQSQIKLFPTRFGFRIGTRENEAKLFTNPNHQNGVWVKNLHNQIQNINRGLNSQNPELENSSGGGGDSGGFLSNIDFGSLFDNIGDFFGGIFGGSGFYKDHYVKSNGQKLVSKYIVIIKALNQAIIANNYAEFSKNVVKLKNEASLHAKAFQKKKNEGWSGFTENNLQASINLTTNFQQEVTSLLNTYLNSYFTSSGVGNGVLTFTSAGLDAQEGFFGTFTGTPVTFTAPVISYLPKQNVNIPAFNIDQDTLGKIFKNQVINTNSWLDSLTNIIKTVTSGNNNSSSGNQGNNNDWANSGSGYVDQNSGFLPKTNNASLFLVAAAAAGYYMYQKKKK